MGAIAGGSVYRKSTFLLDSLGKQILPDWLTIEEHPHLLKGLASTPFDSEGVRTERRDIIKDGILTQWLLTSYSARKLGLKSTGHAGGIHNWRIAGQGLSFEQMLKEMGTGLVVTELMGQGVSAITGDYSRGAAGFWVENGEIQYPVSEITIAGNLKDMWRNIVTVGNDIETRSNIQCGSVLLPEMKIAGSKNWRDLPRYKLKKLHKIIRTASRRKVNEGLGAYSQYVTRRMSVAVDEAV